MENKQAFDKLPSLHELKEIISSIKEADLSKVSYNKLVSALTSLQFVPFVTAKLRKGHSIERARINKPQEIFTTESQISYRTDYSNIMSYGRANVPHFSLFYGAFQSDVIRHPRLVNLLETSEIFRNLEKNEVENADFIMTVGKWIIKEDIEVVEMVFDENSIKNSADIRRSYEFHLEKLTKEHPQHQDQFELILQFFSNQFAKKEINFHYDYMISAAYTDMAINWRGHKGITYPSVKTDYQGHNVVLTPFVVDRYLDLEIAAMYRVEKNAKKSIISPLKHCTDFGPLNSNFKWVDY
ncbi:hypothetical protein [Salinimicrobium sp. HB62]|uniref:hypothetical protein n=1 Tax=Salinimicrobium sp. HB62 TaxID=3077781 RepID=UPI002D799155|nr:hypothetical protein [Salinimicrobium sp. HB62]